MKARVASTMPSMPVPACCCAAPGLFRPYHDTVFSAGYGVIDLEIEDDLSEISGVDASVGGSAIDLRPSPRPARAMHDSNNRRSRKRSACRSAHHGVNGEIVMGRPTNRHAGSEVVKIRRAPRARGSRTGKELWRARSAASRLGIPRQK